MSNQERWSRDVTSLNNSGIGGSLVELPRGPRHSCIYLIVKDQCLVSRQVDFNSERGQKLPQEGLGEAKGCDGFVGVHMQG